ncbi:HAD family hydrolase [Labrys monachus]|uniref:HAD superfamily hydrolase (TIGR01509 family) n=1 Tax=Labrys monachus TaxID=217067 RepID=A0ABU0FNN5_9HYPH|nr:HAD family phosphatase [Labrys monachus]MDQ0396141.1 HAD superfamily hydrolase (TIGR01509 family) [Labrys monachus]
MSADTPFETVLHAPAPVAGLIFDMDGTLVDNMHVHNDAWEVWHQRRGLPFDRATFFQATAGRANREVVRAAMPDASELELDTLGLDKETIYREIYSGRMAPMPGLLDFIDLCLGAGRPMSVATAAPPENAALVLDGLDLRRHFVTVVSPSMGYRGKPHPDLFLAAAEAMKLDPAHCIVFEDAPLGIEAAERAGMRAVGVTTMLEAAILDASNVVFSVADFTDPRLKPLLGL